MYFNIFISLILCIVITLLTVSTVLYINFERILTRQVYSNDIQNLTQTSKEVSLMADMAMTLSSQIYSDMTVQKILFYSQPDVYDIGIAERQLTNYRLSMPFIDSVYIYNGKASTFYIASPSFQNGISLYPIQSKSEFIDVQASEIIDHYKDYDLFIPIPRKLVLREGEDGIRYYYTFLMCNKLAGEESDGAVMVNVREDWIRNVMQNEEPYGEVDTFIIDSTGRLCSNSKSDSMMTDISDHAYIQSILKESGSSGYGVYSVNGVKSLVTYTKTDSFGWRYVRTTPWALIVGKIQEMRKITLLIGICIALFGLLLAYTASKRLYVPIDRMFSRLSRLEMEKRSKVHVLKQEFLRNILLGREITNLNEMEHNFQNLGMKMGKDDEYSLVLFKIDMFNDFSHKYSREDINLYKFALMNIVNELLSSKYKVETVDMGDDSVLALLAGSGDKIPEKVSEDMIKSIQSEVRKHLQFSISVTLNDECSTVEGIHQLYNQVLEASLHRLFYGYECVIHSEKIMELKSNKYEFPFQKEKLLVNALISGKAEEAKNIYGDIIRESAEYPFAVFSFMVSHLVFSINDAVNTIKMNHYSWQNQNIGIPVILVNDAEVLDDVTARFHELFESISMVMKDRKNAKHEDIIQKVNDRINQDYFNPDLSVDRIADDLAMSTPHLCRIYKQYTLQTVLDTIVGVRINKAKELLLETELSVAEIAGKVGFSDDSYFYRTFKKVNKITPSEYRKNYKYPAAL